MKRFFLLIAFFVISFAPAFAQSEFVSAGDADESYSSDFMVVDNSMVPHFVDSFNKLLPYRDEQFGLTITKVTLNKKKNYIHFDVVLDSAKGFEQEKDSYIRFFSTQKHWDINDIAFSSFEIHLYVSNDRHLNNPKAVGALSVVLNQSDIRRMQSISEIRDFVATEAKTLPQKTGDGERYIQVLFDENKMLLTQTWEYEQRVWPDVRKYITDNYESIRTHLIQSMLLDTSEVSGFVYEDANVTLRNLYVNHDHSDTVEMFIAPWMWEKVRDIMVESMIEKTPEEELLAYAHSLHQQCPYTIDSNTVLAGCSFDQSRRVLLHKYEVSELTMHSFKNNPQAQDAMRQSVARTVVSEGFLPLTHLLIKAQSSLEFYYSTLNSQNHFSILFTPEQLQELITK